MQQQDLHDKCAQQHREIERLRQRNTELESMVARYEETEQALHTAYGQLSDNNQFINSLINASPDVIYIYDLFEEQNTFINDGFTRILGYSSQEMKSMGGALITELMHPDDFEMYLRDVVSQYPQIRDGDILSYQYRMQHKNGAWRWLASRELIFARQPDETPGQIFGVAHDITEQKQAEEEIRTLNAELEDRVRQRTAQLEAVNAELKNFAYVVSHDLKAPLRGIMRLAAWLGDDYADAFDENGQEMLELLGDRVRRMDSLIDGVLQYSRIGRTEDAAQSIELAPLAEAVIDSLDHPAHIQIDVQPGLPTVSGDQTRIIQVFQNLLGNAIKFMDKPDGRIEITYQDAGAYWQFRVSDNGPGIEPKHYERIFQIFKTVAPEEHSANTGIGLTIVKKIIEFYGGTIRVESRLEEGSSFIFTLPKKACK